MQVEIGPRIFIVKTMEAQCDGGDATCSHTSWLLSGSKISLGWGQPTRSDDVRRDDKLSGACV